MPQRPSYANHADRGAKSSIENFWPTVLLNRPRFVTRSRDTKYPTKSSERIKLIRLLAKEYRELEELRRRVRKAEATAGIRFRPRRQSHRQNGG
jgi:hypothetical protein